MIEAENQASSPHSGAIRKVHIDEVGGTSQNMIELRGTVLVYHVKTWVGSVSTYIPIEWIKVTRRWRLRSRTLAAGLGTLAAAGGLVATMFLYATALLPVAGVVLLAAAGYAVVAFVRFWRGYPTVRFTVEMTPNQFVIECWDRPGRQNNLNQLIRRIKRLQKNIRDHVPYPIQMTYQRYYVRPWRATFMQALTICAALAVPVEILARYYELPWLRLFLGMPWVYYFGKHWAGRLQQLLEPRSFRDGLKAYEGSHYEDAQQHLDALLRAYPDHFSGLMLQAQVCVSRNEFDKAMQTCDRIATFDLDVGKAMQEEILGIRRMHDRMQQEPEIQEAQSTEQ